MRQALLLYYLRNAILWYFQIRLKFISRNIDKNKNSLLKTSSGCMLFNRFFLKYLIHWC